MYTQNDNNVIREKTKKKPNTEKGVVEHLPSKCEALISNLSTTYIYIIYLWYILVSVETSYWAILFRNVLFNIELLVFSSCLSITDF
jgi:hypothetical protein